MAFVKIGQYTFNTERVTYLYTTCGPSWQRTYIYFGKEHYIAIPDEDITADVVARLIREAEDNPFHDEFSP